MIKKILLLVALLSSAALVQAQLIEVDIRPDELLGGTADEQLQALGAQAAEEGLEISLTSPGYWREMIEEQLRAGAGDTEIAISHRTTFIESVIVRMGERPASAPAPKAPEPAARPAVVERPAPAPAPAAPEIEARPDPAAISERLREEARATVAAAEVERPEAPQVPELAPVVPTIERATALGSEASAAPESSDVSEPEAPVAAESVVETAPVDEAISIDETEVVESATESDAVALAPAPAAPIASSPPIAEAEPSPQAPIVESAPNPEPTVAAEDPAGEADPTELAAVEEQSEAEARASLEGRLNRGSPITKTLSVGQLRRGDQLFTTGGLAAAVRPSRIGRNVYWVEGDLDLEAEGLRRVQAGKYDVLSSIDAGSGDAALAARAPTAAAAISSNVDPGAASAAPAEAESLEDTWIEAPELAEERTEMEARFNLGRPIEAEVTSAGLITNDMLYVGQDLTVVVRRDKVGLKRYWLRGAIDYSIDELEQTGSNRYRVRRVIR